MKIIKNIFKVMAIVAITFFATSCNNDDTGVVEKFPTVAEILKADPANFSILEKALLKTDLLNTFRNPGSYTVFAPTNAAFTTIGLTETVLDSYTTAQLAVLKRQLQYHVLALNLNGQYTTELPADGYMNTYAAAGVTGATAPLTLYVNQTNGIVLNGGTANFGATVAKANVQASNGVVHIINAVMSLPTLVSAIGANPNLSTLKSIVTSTPQATILSAVSAATPTAALTIYAPTNTAFTTATTTTGFLVGANDTTTGNVVRYHVETSNRSSLSATAFIAATAATDLTVNTLFAPNKFIVTKGTLNVKNFAATPVFTGSIKTVNIQTTNGVIHTLDTVMRPL
jgi:uncharacterized surface protein with fasciclin (FAS1) repeats